MGLLDSLAGSRGRGATSPLTLAILGLLAGKGVEVAPRDGSTRDEASRQAVDSANQGGLLSGLLGGGEAKSTDGTPRGFVGALLTGGLMDLVRQFQASGKGGAAESWIGKGDNQPVTPDDLLTVLSEKQIAFLMDRTGLSRAALLDGLTEELPHVVDSLTPDGRVPTAEEIGRTA